MSVKRNSTVLLFVAYVIVVAKCGALIICSGNDVTNDPGISAKTLDGIWHTQRGLTSTRISNTFVFFEDQGRIQWHNDWQTTMTYLLDLSLGIFIKKDQPNTWVVVGFTDKNVYTRNPTTKICRLRKYVNTQKQSLENGPYGPCFDTRQVLPPEDAKEVGEDVFFYMPTKNLLMYYICPPDKVNPDQSCAVRPFVRVMTKTLDISRKELSIIKMRLRQFGVNQVLDVNDPRANGCRIPRQQSRPSKGYGRKYKQ